MRARIGNDLRRVRAHWETHGEQDPLWAVYVAPGTRGGRWDVDAFFATGRAEVERVFAALPVAGRPRGRQVALDFGCGVGRLTRALGAHFDEVIGVDVSAPMLARAREFAQDDPRMSFVLNPRDDLSFVADGAVDLVYSSLVLQHMSRPLASRYLAEFVRVLAADGAAVVQVASRPTVSAKGWAFRLLPAGVLGAAQRRLLGYPAPMRMQAMPDRWFRRAIEHAGGQVLAVSADTTYGGHWTYTRYIFARAGQ
jgi:ubiquinone/menaquinone biosynthesis C-methylase UbiE